MVDNNKIIHNGEVYVKLNTPPLITLDGVTINESEEYYWIYKPGANPRYSFFGLVKGKNLLELQITSNQTTHIFFKDKNKAINWFYENQKCLSITDLLDIIEDLRDSPTFNLLKTKVMNLSPINLPNL